MCFFLLQHKVDSMDRFLTATDTLQRSVYKNSEITYSTYYVYFLLF